MPNTDSHGRPLIVAGDWFGKGPAGLRKLKPGEQPPRIEIGDDAPPDAPPVPPQNKKRN